MAQPATVCASEATTTSRSRASRSSLSIQSSKAIGSDTLYFATTLAWKIL